MTIDDLSSIGITPESIALAISFGFGIVFSFAVLGLVAGFVIRLIRMV